MQISLFLPELALIAMILVLFFASLGSNIKTGSVQGLALIFAALAVVAAVLSFSQQGLMFFDAYRVDAFSQTFKVLITGGLLLVVFMGPGLTGIEARIKPEYYLFLTVSTLGLVFLSSAVELLTILISLEISSYALYVVIPFRRHNGFRVQMEAGIKYVLFGAVSTGLTLFGMSYVFGFAHSTYLSELSRVIPSLLLEQPLAVIGMVMMMCGFFYKLALFPMHFWTPDVYEGAANETTTFVATLPKVGAVALLIRLVVLTGVEVGQFTWILATVAVLSMTVGNLSALVQDDLKRLLAYSSIAHAGYVMVGILSVGELGMSSAIYYIAGYVIMNLACFYVIYHLAPTGENVTFADLKGLHRKSPLLAFTLAAGAFGMAGIPPTVGFTGKFVLFTAAIDKGMYALVILAMVNAAISAFYYLKMVRAAYSQDGEQQTTVVLGMPARLLGVILVLAILLIGIFPQSFIALAREAVAVL
ncbi:MAG: NADH-quinone oxidoreductase subunit N [Deltaproteobacteria bacterium]|nr:NADH-quinone oxidoreductase subunit N [Candidatus Anaeroferrophillus wilburensis]MBN2889989.1 NADH-quinone oxidoreductase subunit N [Deltaproteobacteria bacterium]